MRRPVNVPVLYGQCQAKGFDHIKQGIKCWFAIRRLKKWHISEKRLLLVKNVYFCHFF